MPAALAIIAALLQLEPGIAALLNTDAVTAAKLATDDANEMQAHQDLLNAIAAAKAAGK